MVISRLHRPLSLTLATLGLISLVACGGGGGGDNPPVVINDTTPNAISFTATENAEPNSVITSPAVTISGINTATPISISGGEYSVAGGAFTSTAGTISNGQTLTVRVTASDKTNTPKEATISVGGVSAKFVVTTLADTTPDAFAFTAKTDVAVNSEHTSEVVAINGIDIAVPVSITGGLYSINGAEFTSAIGTVSAGQAIAVKATAANITDTTQNAVLTIGGISSTFAVTTIPDTTPPVAEFKFPTPYTMTEANSVKVRGTATDDHAIVSVKVIVTNNLNTTMLEIPGVPKAEGDFSSWTADVSLTALAENEIKVVAMDKRGNEILIEKANKVVIRQDAIGNAFPDEDVQFESIFQGLAIDAKRNRLMLKDKKRIISVDIESGSRSEFTSGSSMLRSLAIDAENDNIYASSENTLIEYLLSDGAELGRYTSNLVSNFHVLDFDSKSKSVVGVEFEFQGVGGKILDFSVDKKNFSVISSGTEIPFMGSSEGLAVDAASNRLFVTTGGQSENGDHHSVLAVSRADGVRKIFSDNTIGQGEKFLGLLPNDRHAGLFHLEVGGDSLYLGEYPNRLFKLNLLTGDRKLISNISYKNASENHQLQVSYGAMQYDSENHLLFVIESFRDSVFIVDAESEERVILTKSKNDY